MSRHPFDLSGRVALITGSSQGIGLAVARGMARSGAKIILNGRREEKLKVAIAELRKEDIAATYTVFDVTDRDSVNSQIQTISEIEGEIDILVNNAGIQHRTPLQEYSDASWRELMAVNLDSVFFVAKAVANRMIPRRRGKIINICSLQSEAGRFSIAPYAASKGAVKMLTKAMCVDWASYGIQVNGLGPGYFDTPLNSALVADSDFSQWVASRTPAGRWGKLEDLHGPAVFLASEASDFVNGHILYVDGGMLAAL